MAGISMFIHKSMKGMVRTASGGFEVNVFSSFLLLGSRSMAIKSWIKQNISLDSVSLI